MAKEIIVLDVTKPNGVDNNVAFVFWLPVTPGRETPKPGYASLWRGAQAADNTLIQNGNIIEEYYSIQYPPTATKTQIQADLVAKFNARLTQLNALPNPNQFYGVFFDSVTGWSA